MKIHFFNPGHETAVLNGSPYYMAPANVATMQQELAYLPAWYGDKDDKVLVQEDAEYFSFLKNNFHFIPQAITQDKLTRYSEAEVSLWGISPQAIHIFTQLNQEYGINLNIPLWHNEYTILNSRQNAKDCLEEIVLKTPQIQDSILPKFYTNLEEIDHLVNHSTDRLLAKAPYSSSGRGLLWLPDSGLTRTENQILHGILKKQGSVSIERVLNKNIDFAMEFLSDGIGNITFAGYSLFNTNSKGAYESNYLGAQESIIKKLVQHISDDLLKEIQEKLVDVLKKKYAHMYKGCIGVDMMIYTDNGEYKLHPCVEINMRYNMGYLSLKISENYIAPDSNGYFFIDFNPKQGKMYEKHITMQQEFPMQSKDGKIMNGYLSLCPINEESRYRAYILVH